MLAQSLRMGPPTEWGIRPPSRRNAVERRLTTSVGRLEAGEHREVPDVASQEAGARAPGSGGDGEVGAVDCVVAWEPLPTEGTGPARSRAGRVAVGTTVAKSTLSVSNTGRVIPPRRFGQAVAAVPATRLVVHERAVA